MKATLEGDLYFAIPELNIEYKKAFSNLPKKKYFIAISMANAGKIIAKFYQ